jgi:hypothetical protein
VRCAKERQARESGSGEQIKNRTELLPNSPQFFFVRGAGDWRKKRQSRLIFQRFAA